MLPLDCFLTSVNNIYKFCDNEPSYSLSILLYSFDILLREGYKLNHQDDFYNLNGRLGYE